MLYVDLKKLPCIFNQIIPLKTVSEANIREHWGISHSRHKRQHEAIWLSFRNHPTQIPLPCAVKFIRLAPRKLDSDNLQMSFKWIRDAVSEQIIKNKARGHADNDERIGWLYAQEKSKEYAIRIEIYQLPSLDTFNDHI